MAIRNEDLEIKQLEYDLAMQKVWQQCEEELSDLERRLFSEAEGHVFSSFTFGRDEEMVFPLIFLHPSGWYLFLTSDKELTDPKLWEELGEWQQYFLTSLKEVSENQVTIYVLTQGPICQKLFYGLYNSGSEFLTPISDLQETVFYELEEKKPCYTYDELAVFSTKMEALADGEEEEVLPNSNYYKDKTGMYVKKHGDWKRVSDLDPEVYYRLTLFGGFFGLHKFYAQQYGNFLLYLFTFGFFGVGWFFDMVEILLEVAKDKEKRYICPFADRKQKLLSFAAGAIVFLCFLIVFLKFL